MGKYNPTDEQQEAYIYCMNNNIKISPKGINGQNKWYVEVFANGKWHHSPEKHGPVEVWEVFFNYCKHYYDKQR